jgi:excisionase family DNA binding protein
VTIERQNELTEQGFMSVREAAKFSSVSRSRLYELMAAGQLPYAQLGARRMVPKAGLLELMRSCLAGAVPAGV